MHKLLGGRTRALDSSPHTVQARSSRPAPGAPVSGVAAPADDAAGGAGKGVGPARGGSPGRPGAARRFRWEPGMGNGASGASPRSPSPRPGRGGGLACAHCWASPGDHE